MNEYSRKMIKVSDVSYLREQDADKLGNGEPELFGKGHCGLMLVVGDAYEQPRLLLRHPAPSPGGGSSEPSHARWPRGAGHPPHGVVYDRSEAQAETERAEAPASPRKPS